MVCGGVYVCVHVCETCGGCMAYMYRHVCVYGVCCAHGYHVLVVM